MYDATYIMVSLDTAITYLSGMRLISVQNNALPWSTLRESRYSTPLPVIHTLVAK